MSESVNPSESPVVAGSSSTSNNNTNRKPPEIDYTKLPAGKELKSENLPAPKDWRPWDRVKLPVDILLLTVVDCEFLACAHYLKPEFYTSCHEKLGPVCFGEIGEEGQDSLKIALYQSPDKGPTEATIVVKNTVEVLKPKAAIWVGFCGGLKEDKVKSGDVVISSKLRTYSAEKVTEERTVDRNIAAPSFKNFLNLLKFADHGWNPPLKDEAGLKVKVVKNGVLLSGPKVVDNKKLRSERTERFPDADAIEMEGEGKSLAAESVKKERVGQECEGWEGRRVSYINQSLVLENTRADKITGVFFPFTFQLTLDHALPKLNNCSFRG